MVGLTQSMVPADIGALSTLLLLLLPVAVRVVSVTTLPSLETEGELGRVESKLDTLTLQSTTSFRTTGGDAVDERYQIPDDWMLVFGGNTDAGFDRSLYAVNLRLGVWKVSLNHVLLSSMLWVASTISRNGGCWIRALFSLRFSLFPHFHRGLSVSPLL